MSGEGFTGAIALITGASDGLGEAIAECLSREGATVWLASRNEQKLQKVVESLNEKGYSARFIVCDVTNEQSIEDAVGNIISKDKKIDILVNNAGIWIEGNIEDLSVERIRNVFNTNTLGLILMTRCVIPGMKQRKSGKILNIISTAGLRPRGDWSVYVASKFAVRGFSESMKLATAGCGIKIMDLYPGGMGTKFFEKAGVSLTNSEPWMMNRYDVAEIVVNMIRQRGNILLDNLEIRKLS